MTPFNVNKHLRKALKDLGIDKPVTCYSLKRNGVTMRRLRGETDMEIQHAARWTSAKQLRTYDMTQQDDAFRRELEKRGLIPSTTVPPPQKVCAFCKKPAGLGDLLCPHCQRPLDRTAIVKGQVRDDEVSALRAAFHDLRAELGALKEHLLPELAREIREAKQGGLALVERPL